MGSGKFHHSASSPSRGRLRRQVSYQVAGHDHSSGADSSGLIRFYFAAPAIYSSPDLMPVLELRTVIRTQGNNQALKDRAIAPSTCRLEFQDVPVLIDAFRRMVRGLEFDVCEMAL